MPDKIKFFTADYRDKYVYIKGKKFLIGGFAVDFLVETIEMCENEFNNVA